MGSYVNPNSDGFWEAVNSEIYVDKTELIRYTNKVIRTSQKYICVSRPRRFGKSMAANMLAAYYSRGCDAGEVFAGLKIASDETFEKHLNRYNVIFLNMQEFISSTRDVDKMIERIRKVIMYDMKNVYPDVNYLDETDLLLSLRNVYDYSGKAFIWIIDEWDCLFREYARDFEAQRKYLDFLRNLLKDKTYVYLAYMTGILPIKKYGTHSALNMFSQFSMTDADYLSEFVGFTENEVTELCGRYQMDLEELKFWYDGYRFPGVGEVYSPKSVVESLMRRSFGNYWNQTETFEALRVYIDMNFLGLKDDIVSMMMGEKIAVNTGNFGNDMTTFHTKDDVLTLLIHLGYLGYERETQKVFIPNNEVLNEYKNAIRVSDWGVVTESLKNSELMLEAVLQKDEGKVAAYMERAHYETSHLQYNDENALSYTISLALYSARNYYRLVRELPAGKGFADMVFLPHKRYAGRKPALIVELKWDKSAHGAIEQIRKKNYPQVLNGFYGQILLVGVNYDKKTKQHACEIEEFLLSQR